MALKLRLLGYDKNEDIGDPFPVIIPGEDKPIPSSKIEDYVNEDLYHYYEFYIYCKHAGAPYSGGWLEYPPWIPQLLTYFDIAIDAVRAHNEREAYRQARLNHGGS